MSRFCFTLVALIALTGCNSPDVGEPENAATSPSSSVTTVISTDARSGASASTSTSSTDGTGTSVSTSASSNSGGGASASSSTSISNGALTTAEETGEYEFGYSWPGEAGREPELSKLLGARLDAARSEIKSQSAEAKADAAANDVPFRQHSLKVDWQVDGNTSRFLSLSAAIASYGGGAHGNLGYDALVWDREIERPVAASDFFASEKAMSAALNPRYCPALNGQRANKRGALVEADSNDLFDQCPPIKDLDIVLESSNGETFDRIGLLAAPYVAGPYVEGDYQVYLPVDKTVIAAIKPAYRKYFSVR
jgi:hypothetical protein